MRRGTKINWLCWIYSKYFYPLAFQPNGAIIFASVCLSIRKFDLVRVIIRHRFAPNMHGILSTGIEIGGHWPWSSRSFWLLWPRILGNLLVLVITCHRFGVKLSDWGFVRHRMTWMTQHNTIEVSRLCLYCGIRYMSKPWSYTSVS